MISSRIFNGKLNVDTQAYRLPPGDFSDALNITRNAQGSGQDMVVSNLVGNELVSYTLPAGVNKRIGSKEDLVRNRIYYFVWNSNDYNSILYYDKTNNTVNKLLENLTDTNGVDVLAFNPSYRINHVDIIYRDEGDLMYWTDGLNRPFVLNVQDAIDGTYSTNWKETYLTVNRPMPLIAAICDYADDNTVNINNLRKKLYQFKYRWVYRDFTKSCWSPVSKLFAPANPDDIATDINPTKNNRIDVTINTGDLDCVKLEIAARQSIDTTYSDFFLVASLDKTELSIASNSIYTYNFYNDSSYPYIDITESLLLYSYVPQKAYTQALPNGNVPIYGATTEGYDFNETLDVTSSVALIDNSSSTSLSITVTESSYDSGIPPDPGRDSVIYTFSGGVTGVSSITLYLTNIATTVVTPFTYTLNPGDDITAIIAGFHAMINGSPIAYDSITTTTGGNYVPPDSIMVFPITTNTGISGSFTISYSGSTPVTDINISAYKHRARYSWGLVYFDEFGETDGVKYDASSMSLLMPELDTTGGTAPKIPQITFQVNHKPPIWATNFAWVRTTNLTFLSSLATVSFTTKKDSTNTFAYLQITNLQQNQNGYSAYEFTPGDRVRIIGKFVAGAAGTVSESDFPIVDLLTDPTIDGTVNNGIFIKVPYSSALSGFGSSNSNYFIEIYTPAANTSSSQQVFYEFGENYSVINPGQTNRAHGGQQQDQIIGTQPAIFNFNRGDFYQRKRIYLLALVNTTATTWVMSQSVSDLYPSQVQSIGRAFVIDNNSKQTYFPTLIRFGGEYQQSTDVNQTNFFYPENFDEYDRSNGDIRKLFIEGRRLYVFQKFDIGVVPILTQVVRDVAGNPLEANSDQLLNKITYPYKGKYGIGDVPESFAYHDYAKYGVDDNKGVVWRLSQDGITELSVIYECNAFFVDKLRHFRADLNNGIAASGQTYTGNPTVYGCFDFYTNKYIVALEEINRYSSPTTLTFHQDPYTLIFCESKDSTEGFECFTSYYPEGMTSLGTLFVTFKNGQIWTHDSDTHNQFYGTNYESSITGVFNDAPHMKKTWIGIEESANTIWDCPEITSQVNSYDSTNQTTSLVSGEFTEQEGQYSASIKRDANSPGGKINGNTMKGNWLKVKFRVQNASNFVFLSQANVKFIQSPLNIQ